MMKPFRLAISTAGEKCDLDFRAHEHDPEHLVVCKAAHPEAFDNLILVTGVDPEVQTTVQGSHYFITTLTKAGAAKLLSAVVVGLVTKSEAAQLSAQYGSGEEEEEVEQNDIN